jgi:hypothetical protein
MHGKPLEANSIGNTFDRRPALGKFFLEPFESAIKMIDPVDDRFAFCCEPGNDK